MSYDSDYLYIELTPQDSFERLTIPGGTSQNPSMQVETTFIITTGSGSALGELPDGIFDGQIKYIIAQTLANFPTVSTVPYLLDVTTLTTLYTANGIVASGIQFTDVGNSVNLVWSDNSSAWYILGTGATIV